jgi:hypothetical protein
LLPFNHQPLLAAYCPQFICYILTPDFTSYNIHQNPDALS